MAERYFNPFQGVDINVPISFHDQLVRFSQREGKPVLDQSPFPRMVDMWFLAVCVAARQGISPVDQAVGETRKIIEGSIFGSDPWRVHMLMLICIAHAGSVDVVSEPRKMMALANGLAVAGLPTVVDMLSGEDGEPIWNLSESIEKMIKSHAA